MVLKRVKVFVRENVLPSRPGAKRPNRLVGSGRLRKPAGADGSSKGRAAGRKGLPLHARSAAHLNAAQTSLLQNQSAVSGAGDAVQSITWPTAWVMVDALRCLAVVELPSYCSHHSPKASRVVLAGSSFGRFLAPRAAAFEHRVAAHVADPGQWDQRDNLLDTLPLSDADKAAFPHVDRRCSPRWSGGWPVQPPTR